MDIEAVRSELAIAAVERGFASELLHKQGLGVAQAEADEATFGH